MAQTVGGPVLATILKDVLSDHPSPVPTDSQLLSSMAFAGTIVGMLLFGALSDFTGRRGGMLAAVRPLPRLFHLQCLSN